MILDRHVHGGIAQEIPAGSTRLVASCKETGSYEMRHFCFSWDALGRRDPRLVLARISRQPGNRR